jgi:hypothetical protein
MSYIDDLERLKKLLDEGTITLEEFEHEKIISLIGRQISIKFLK